MKKDYLLIDTCVWIYFFNKNEEVVKIITDLISSDKYEICTNDIIKYELEIGMKRKSDFILWREEIENKLTVLPITDQRLLKNIDFYKKELLRINEIKNINNSRVTPTAADLFIGSQVINYEGAGLKLLTSNHKDFPTHIFKRDKNIFWADTLGSSIPICFYYYKK